jgi:TPR repeat protein
LAAAQGLGGPLRDYYDPDPGAPADQSFVKFLERNATDGNVNAAVRLGHIYRQGTGIQADQAAALDWFLQAALKDHPQAQASLTYMYQHGEGGDINLNEALFWYEKTAALDEPMAQTNLGWMLNQGIGAASDAQRAMTLFQAAAKQDYGYAQNNTGHVLLHNHKPAQSSEAITWFRKAAELGIDAAQTSLGVAKSLDQSLAWYQRAAIQQHPPAMEALGYLLQVSGASNEDLAQSKIWFERAAAKGSVYPPTQSRLNILVRTWYRAKPTTGALLV